MPTTGPCSLASSPSLTPQQFTPSDVNQWSKADAAAHFGMAESCMTPAFVAETIIPSAKDDPAVVTRLTKLFIADAPVTEHDQAIALLAANADSAQTLNAVDAGLCRRWARADLRDQVKSHGNAAVAAEFESTKDTSLPTGGLARALYAMEKLGAKPDIAEAAVVMRNTFPNAIEVMETESPSALLEVRTLYPHPAAEQCDGPLFQLYTNNSATPTYWAPGDGDLGTNQTHAMKVFNERHPATPEGK